MRRRGRSDDTGYDSVLDTMTNVVGILIIVLAVAELGVDDALRRTVRVRALGLRAVHAQEPGRGPETQSETILAIPIPDERRSEGRKRVSFMCRNGRILPLDEDLLKRLFAEHTSDLRQRLEGEALREAIVERFDEEQIGDDHVRMRFEEAASLRPDGSVVRTLRAEILPRHPAAGETAGELQKPGSRFLWSLASFDPQRDWLYFLVWDDSFDTYVEARRLADRAGFVAGWKPFDRETPYTELIGVESTGGREGLPD